jgi:hypothetical protein
MKVLITEKQYNKLIDLINEITSEEGYKNYYSGLFDKEDKDSDKEFYEKVIKLDPTFKSQIDKLGEYTKWLFRKDNVDILKNTKEEDFYKIKNDLEFFTKLKTRGVLPLEKRDINKFDIDELATYIFDIQKKSQDYRSNAEKEKEIKKEVNRFELENYIIVIPKTEEAACYYGAGTRWCTAAKGNNYFNHYNNQGPLYILISKQDPSEKYQFHFESNQFMDSSDDSIDLAEFMSDNQDVYEFFGKKMGNEIDFQILLHSIQYYRDENYFREYYSNDFSDSQKAKLLRAAFEVDGNSDYYNTVSIALDYIDYPDISLEFRNRFLAALGLSLNGNEDYDDEVKMFIEALGGINKENIKSIIEKVDLDSSEEVNQLYRVSYELDAENLLIGYLKNNTNVNIEMVKTMNDLKNSEYYVDSTVHDHVIIFDSKLVLIKIYNINMENGKLGIILYPKDKNGNILKDKAEEGSIDYRNLINYLTNPQLF